MVFSVEVSSSETYKVITIFFLCAYIQQKHDRLKISEKRKEMSRMSLALNVNNFKIFIRKSLITILKQIILVKSDLAIYDGSSAVQVRPCFSF